ncbi:hypothetical protein LTS18_010439 [Coniosporium uncinatum]|uniref:Uncharacterized protein n=1 Tax=Coniosporium uncinatum TaxID=93489 RepID=A0ACC3CZQ9_9PEZI|nr:hypothetical protein LTS18_010439 [Coniosporium uncinatum]
MGAVHCAVFTIKEKPWRHIKGNVHGTFLGSLQCMCCMTRSKNEDEEADAPCDAIRNSSADETANVASTATKELRNFAIKAAKPIKALMSSNRNGERMHAEAERARERLKSELKDRREISKASGLMGEEAVPKSVRIQNALERVESSDIESDEEMSLGTKGKPKGWTGA